MSSTDPSSDPDDARLETDTDGTTMTTPGTETGLIPLESAGVAGVVAIIAMVGLGVATTTTLATVGGLILGAVVIGSIAAVAADRASFPLLGGLLLLGATAGAAGLPASFAMSNAPITAGMSLAGVVVGAGIVRFRVAAIGSGAVSRAIAWVLRVTFVTAFVALVVALVSLDISQLIMTVGPASPLSVLVGTGSDLAPLGFLIVSWLAFAGVWLVVTVLPPAAVLPPSKRARYAAVRSRSIVVAGVVFGGVGTFLAVVSLLALETGVARGVMTAVIVPIVGSVPLRSLLLQLFFLGAVLTALLLFVRSVGASIAYRRPAWIRSGIVIAVGGLLAAVVGGGQAVAGVRDAGLIPGQMLDSATMLVGPTAIGLVGIVIGLVGIAAVLAVLPVVSGLGLLPSTTAGPRLAVGGLLLGAITGAAGDAAPITLFVAVVAAIVVWDVGEFGVSRTADVGLAPAHRDGDVVHTGASLLVGLGGVVGAFALSRVATGVTGSSEGIVVVILFGAIVTVVSAVLLRG